MRSLQARLEELEEKAGNNVFSFFTKVLKYVDFRDKKSILFPLHNIYQIEGHPVKAEENMFAPIRQTKKVFNEQQAKKIKINLQLQLPGTIDKKSEENKEKKNHDTTENRENALAKKKELDQFPGILRAPDRSMDLVREHGNFSDHNAGPSSRHFGEGEDEFPSQMKQKDLFVDVDRSEKLVEYGLNLLSIRFDEQMANYRSDPILSNIMNEYHLESVELMEHITHSLLTKQSIRSTIFLALKKIPLFEVVHGLDKKDSYPLNRYFYTTFWNNLKKFPTEAVRDYFGEQVALYFAFLNFFRDKLFWISFFGIGIAIVKTYAYVLNQSTDLDSGDGTSLTYVRFHDAVVVIFTILVPIWCKSFEISWANYEKEFAVEYGSSSDLNFDSTESIRPNFKGVWKRSIKIDQVNSMEEDQTRKRNSFYMIFALVVICIGAAAVSAYYLLNAKRLAFKENWLNYQNTTQRKSDYYDSSPENQVFVNVSYFDPNETVFNILELIRIYILQLIFEVLIKKLIERQNLKYKLDFENQHILFLSVFQLLNNSFMPMIVGWQSLLSSELEITQDDGSTRHVTHSNCLREDCDQELSNYFLVYCCVQLFIVIVVKLLFFKITSFTTQLLKKAYYSGIKKMGETFKTLKKSTTTGLKRSKTHNVAVVDDGAEEQYEEDDYYDEDELVEIEKKREVDRVVMQHYKKARIPKNLISELGHIKKTGGAEDMDKSEKNPYQMIDAEIERQVELKGGDAGGDDSHLNDYLQLYNAYSFTCLFAGLFPITFASALLIGLIESYIDQLKVKNEMRRGVPQTKSSIGLWNDMIKLATQLAIITNSFYVSFILFEKRSTWVKFSTFVIMMIAVQVLMQVYSALNSGLSESTEIGQKRSNFVESLLFPKGSGFGGFMSTNKQVKPTVSKIFKESPPSKKFTFDKFMAEEKLELETKTEMNKSTAMFLLNGKKVIAQMKEFNRLKQRDVSDNLLRPVPVDSRQPTLIAPLGSSNKSPFAQDPIPEPENYSLSLTPVAPKDLWLEELQPDRDELEERPQEGTGTPRFTNRQPNETQGNNLITN